MAEEDILTRAKALLGGDSSDRKGLPVGGAESLAKARTVLKSAGSLDVYLAFDTTGSMYSYIGAVRDSCDQITTALFDGISDVRLSVNGIGDHCDGENWLQMYALSSRPGEVLGSIESIVMTFGGDEPEAYECLAFELAKRLPEDSQGRKRAVILIADSVPHGMGNNPRCQFNVDYQKSFEALKTVCDGFYLVGCNPATYNAQKGLIDPAKTDKELFVPLGSMVDTLPYLLIALAKKTESEKVLSDYLRRLELKSREQANTVRGLLSK